MRHPTVSATRPSWERFCRDVAPVMIVVGGSLFGAGVLIDFDGPSSVSELGQVIPRTALGMLLTGVAGMIMGHKESLRLGRFAYAAAAVPILCALLIIMVISPAPLPSSARGAVVGPSVWVNTYPSNVTAHAHGDIVVLGDGTVLPGDSGPVRVRPLLTPQEQGALTSQLADARTAANRYLDIRVALNDGYVQWAQDLPGIGAHFVRWDMLNDGEFDPAQPEVLLYSFQQDAWRFVGLMYALPPGTNDVQPEVGFVGAIREWHNHEKVCERGGEIIGIYPPREWCAERGGTYWPRTMWMLHVWLGTPSEDLFAHVNPLLEANASWKLYTPGDPVALEWAP